MAFMTPCIPASRPSFRNNVCPPLRRRVVLSVAQNATPNNNAPSQPSPSSAKGNDGADKNSPFADLQVPSGKVRARRQVRGGGRRLVGNVKTQGRHFVKLPPNPPGLRVGAGTAKGRMLASPNVYLRPMMGKVREALFSMLGGFGVIQSDASMLDLFAGTGSIGIEALSRGMASAVLVDYARECTDTTTRNLEKCGFAERGRAVCSRVEDFVPLAASYNNGKHYDLITITPPYEEVDYKALMDTLVESDCVGEGTFVVVEYPVELKMFPPTIGYRLVGVRNRKYGRTMLAVYACQPDVDIDLRPDEFELTRRKH